MIESFNNYLVLLPILLPLAGAMLAIPMRKNCRVQGTWSFGIMVASLGVTAYLAWIVIQTGEALVLQIGGWSAPYGISMVADPLSLFFVIMAQLSLTMGVLYALGSRDKVVRYPTFYPLLLALGTGLTGTFLTGDLFNLFVFAELLVISGTILAALSDDRTGVEAGLKYFYISLLASTTMLLAIGCFYVSYGTLNMADLALRLSVGGERLLLLPGIALLMTAFLIKSAVVPFHFWQPDLYMAAPTSVAAVLAGVVSKLGVYGLLRMNTLMFPEQAPRVQIILIVLGVAGVIYGGLGAIGTKNLKRMLAYSSIAQMGFIIVGVGWGTLLALTAVLVFAFNHSLIKSAMIMLAGYISSRTDGKSAAFNNLRGLGRPLPLSGLLFFVGALALAGIPPTNGFVSKMLLYESGIMAESFLSLFLIGVASILTMVYAIRAFMLVWWGSAGGGVTGRYSGDRLVAPLLLVLLVIILGLWAEPLVHFAGVTSAWISDPEFYIQAVFGGG